MKEKLTTKEVPANYLRCQNMLCTQSGNCLRFQAAMCVDNDTPCFSIVNPVYVATQESCPFFRPFALTRFALGITHLFDNLPHTKAVTTRKNIDNKLGKNMFYRILNKERLIKPEVFLNSIRILSHTIKKIFSLVWKYDHLLTILQVSNKK